MVHSYHALRSRFRQWHMKQINPPHTEYLPRLSSPYAEHLSLPSAAVWLSPQAFVQQKTWPQNPGKKPESRNEWWGNSTRNAQQSLSTLSITFAADLLAFRPCEMVDSPDEFEAAPLSSTALRRMRRVFPCPRSGEAWAHFYLARPWRNKGAWLYFRRFDLHNKIKTSVAARAPAVPEGRKSGQRKACRRRDSNTPKE